MYRNEYYIKYKQATYMAQCWHAWRAVELTGSAPVSPVLWQQSWCRRCICWHWPVDRRTTLAEWVHTVTALANHRLAMSRSQWPTVWEWAWPRLRTVGWNQLRQITDADVDWHKLEETCVDNTAEWQCAPTTICTSTQNASLQKVSK